MVRFVMLVGPAGSGKSTVAKNMCSSDSYVVVSSDSIREELFGDESIQGDPSEIFKICRVRCIEALHNGQNVILDATNLNRKNRRSFLNDVKNRAGVPIYCEAVVVAITYEDCIAQNKKRTRQVPDYVIHKHFCQFQMPLYSEGWDKISVVNNSKVNLNEMLERCKGFKHENVHHKYDVYEHIIRTNLWILNGNYNEDLTSEDTILLNLLALWHDVGKLYTKVYTDKKGNPTSDAHFYSHEAWSSMYSLCDDVFPSDYRVKLAQLVSLHMMKYQPEYDTFVDRWVPEYRKILDIFNKADAENA